MNYKDVLGRKSAPLKHILENFQKHPLKTALQNCYS